MTPLSISRVNLVCLVYKMYFYLKCLVLLDVYFLTKNIQFICSRLFVYLQRTMRY